MAGAMVGNPEVSFSTIVSFIIYDLPRIDGTQNGIANKVFLNTQNFFLKTRTLIFSHFGLPLS